METNVVHAAAQGGAGFRIGPGYDRQDVPVFGAARLCAVQSSGGHTKSGKSTALALYGKAKRCPRSESSLGEPKRRLTPRLGTCCYWRIAHEFPSGIRVGLVHESDTPPFANRNEVS
jgi:hypothetical protein